MQYGHRTPLVRGICVFLTGGDEWKVVAEAFGLTPEEIRFLDKRTLNPSEATLDYISRRCRLTVGELYDLLLECGFPVVADLL